MDIFGTREEFKNLEYTKPTEKFNGFVIVPTGDMHDSGFGCMKFALTYHETVVGCVGGGSDVVNLNGIGGFGKYDADYMSRVSTRHGDIVDWCIDCLPCGLIRVFTSRELSLPGYILSNFEVFAEENRA